MNKIKLEDTEADKVAQRLKSQFAPAYLTLASIIQGVALSTLVARVEATNTGFDAVAWLLTITTFLVILDIWNEYLMMVQAYIWLPSLLDSIVPFAFLAAETLPCPFCLWERAWMAPCLHRVLSCGHRGVVPAKGTSPWFYRREQSDSDFAGISGSISRRARYAPHHPQLPGMGAL